jgi:hypothetical protein
MISSVPGTHGSWQPGCCSKVLAWLLSSIISMQETMAAKKRNHDDDLDKDKGIMVEF